MFNVIVQGFLKRALSDTGGAFVLKKMMIFDQN